MDLEPKKDFRLIDPRQQDIDKTTSSALYTPALEELDWVPPLYVLLYNQIRYYEDYGKLKIGYSIASRETLAEQFGVTVEQIDQAFNTLTNKKHLGNWIVSDKSVFRNVKKVWVSNVRQARGTMEDVKTLLAAEQNSARIRAKLCQNQSKTLPAAELPSLDDPCAKVRESNINIGSAYASSANADSANATPSSSADADSDDIKNVFELPFDEDVDEVVCVKPKANKNEFAKAGVIYSKVCDKLGIKKVRSNNAVTRIKQLLDGGFTEDDILNTIEWSKTDDFYAGSGINTRLSDDAIQKAQLARVNNKQRRNNDNVELEAIF